MKNYFLTSVFVVFSSLVLFSQKKEDVTVLFKNGDYEAVITKLKTKSLKKELTFNECYFITKAYGRLKKYNNGLAYAEKMITKAKQVKDTANLLKAYNLKAENLIDLGEMKLGLRFCDSVSVFFRVQDSIEFQKLCFKWGMLAYHNKNYEKAYEIYNKITKKEYRKLSLFNHNYALTLEGLKKYNKAIYYFEKDVTYKLKKNQKHLIASNLINIANIYLKQSKLQKTKMYLDSAKVYLNDEQILFWRKFLLKSYYKYFKEKHNLDSATVYLEKIEEINNTIFNKKINEEMEALKLSFQKEKSLLETIQKEEEKTLILEKQKLKLLAIGSFILTILVVVLSFNYYKNIRIKYKNIRLEQKILRSQITPHFIFNSFSVLQGIISNNEIGKASNYVNKFSKLMRAMLNNSREEFVLLFNEIEILKTYIELQNMKSENKIEYSITMPKNTKNNAVFVPSMLLQPFVENSIKHGFTPAIKKPKLIINLFFEEQKLVCTIIDNGIGISKSKKNKKQTTSLGTLITKERLEVLSKEYKTTYSFNVKDIKNGGKTGTLVYISLPYKTHKNVKRNNSRG